MSSATGFAGNVMQRNKIPQGLDALSAVQSAFARIEFFLERSKASIADVVRRYNGCLEMLAALHDVNH